MVSVAIADYIQFCVLSLAMGLITYCAIKAVGWNEIFAATERLKGEGGINPLAHNEYGWSYLIYMFLVGFGGGAVWQTAVIRACALKSEGLVKPLYKAASLSFLIRQNFPAFWGACAFVFFASQGTLDQFAFQGTDGTIPTMAGLPLFLAQIIPTGLLGLVAAGMLAAFMSTHDSYLLCWSSVITQDIVAPVNPNMSHGARIRCSRISIFVIGIFLLVWGLWFKAPDTLWSYMAGTGTIYFAGAFPVLLGGLYWKRASKTGAMLSLLLGLVGIATVLNFKDMAVGTRWEGTFLTETHFWGNMTYLVCAVAFVAGSVLWPDREVEKS
jgi:solute:Na+ symporter, SSS family